MEINTTTLILGLGLTLPLLAEPSLEERVAALEERVQALEKSGSATPATPAAATAAEGRLRTLSRGKKSEPMPGFSDVEFHGVNRMQRGYCAIKLLRNIFEARLTS